MEDDDAPKGVAAANARTAALRDAIPPVGGQPKGSASPAPTDTPPAEPSTQEPRAPVRFVSAVPEDAEDTPSPTPSPGDQRTDPKGQQPTDVAKLTQEIAELRSKLEDRPSEPPPPPPDIQTQLGERASGDPDIRALATEYNENVKKLSELVAVDENGEMVLHNGQPVSGPLRDDLNELALIEKSIKEQKTIGGLELDEDQIDALKDQKRDLKERIAERKDVVRSLSQRNRLLQRGYNSRIEDLRGELEREREAMDREETESAREAESLRVWEDTMPKLLEPYGITRESTPDDYAEAERLLASRMADIQGEKGDFPDLAVAMKEHFDHSVGRFLGRRAGQTDAAEARRKAAETGQRHPTGAAANADLKVPSDLSPRERRIAAATRTARLTRDVRAVR